MLRHLPAVACVGRVDEARRPPRCAFGSGLGDAHLARRAHRELGGLCVVVVVVVVVVVCARG